MRKEIFEKYHVERIRVTELARLYHVSRVTIYKVLKRARQQELYQRSSTNLRYRSLEYGLKRLAKIEQKLEEKLKTQAKRYNKAYPGEMLHVDTCSLPHLRGESRFTPQECLHIAIDDFSRELYAAILPDKTSASSALFLKQVLAECPYTIEQVYSDNGVEYKGNPDKHAFMQACAEHGITQRFTRVRTPRTNGKAERVIRTIFQMWHDKHEFTSRAQRKVLLVRFVNYCNTVWVKSCWIRN